MQGKSHLFAAVFSEPAIAGYEIPPPPCAACGGGTAKRWRWPAHHELPGLPPRPWRTSCGHPRPPFRFAKRGRKSACFAALGLLAASFVSPAFADDAEQVVVTASRIPEPRERTGESISVITANDLSRQQTIVLTDALAQVPGLTVVRNGGIGQPTSVSIRGAETGQTLVLVDGVRINDPSSVDDQAILADLFANNIDRVEVLRGPQSTLYGSDAIGGVVNVITRRGGSDALGATASAEGGSFDTYRANVGVNGTSDALDYGGAASFFHTNGISAADARNGNPETDGDTNFGATANLRYNASENVSIDLRSYYTYARDDFDDNFVFLPYPPFFRVADSGAYNTNSLFAGYGGVNFDLFSGNLHNRMAMIGSTSVRKFFDSAFDTIHENSDDDGDALRLEYQGLVDLGPGDHLTFGAESERTTFQSAVFNSNPLFASDAQGHKTTAGIYGQYETLLFDQLTMTGGLRYEHDETFGDHVSVKLAGAWSPNDGATVLHANYGDGFKAPSLYELFSQYSNPLTALRPESARGYEAGLDQRLLGGALRLSVTWFERRTKDQIDFFDCFSDPTAPGCAQRLAQGGFYFNVGRTRARGFEGEATFAIDETLAATLDYTNMTAVVTQSDSDAGLVAGNDLARRPHVLADARLDWTPWKTVSLGASVGYVGPRWDDVANTVHLGSNTLVNLYVRYALTDRLSLYGRMENVADAHYEPVYGYGAAGRAIYGGVRASY